MFPCRHLGKAMLTNDALDALLRGTHTVATHGIPQDARIVHCGYDHERLTLYAIYEHETFGKVYSGGAIPWLEVVLVPCWPAEPK